MQQIIEGNAFVINPSIHTLSDIYLHLKTDEDFRRYFESVRWEKEIRCPFCNTRKIYKLNNRIHYRCGINYCDHPFTVATKSLISGSQMKLSAICIALFSFYKSKMGISVTNIADIISVSFDTANILKHKMEYALSKSRNGDPPMVFKSALFYLLTTFKEEMFKKENVNNFTLFEGEMNISDAKTYAKLLLYIERKINYTSYIYIKFAEPEEILAESYIYISENNLGNNATDIIKAINRTVAKMWYRFTCANPIMHDRMVEKRKSWKLNGRINLKTWYLLSIEKEKKWNKDSLKKIKSEDILADPAYLIEIKERIIAYRAKKIKEDNVLDESEFSPVQSKKDNYYFKNFL